jgi:TRAP-type mannitol/chloroaromatic compound transport system permease large subunit
VTTGQIFLAVVPYVGMSLLLLAAVFWLPQVATWLPKLIG